MWEIYCKLEQEENLRKSKRKEQKFIIKIISICKVIINQKIIIVHIFIKRNNNH